MSAWADWSSAPGARAPPTKLLSNTWLSGERPGHFDEIHVQAAMLRPGSVSGTTNPEPFSEWLIDDRGYELAIVAMDV